MVQPLWKTAWQFLLKLNIHFSYDLVIPVLGIYPGEMKACLCTMTCTLMVMAGYSWKTEKCSNSTVYKQVTGSRTVVLPYMEYYSAIKRDY